MLLMGLLNECQIQKQWISQIYQHFFQPKSYLVSFQIKWKKHCPFKRGPWNDGYEDHSHDDILPLLGCHIFLLHQPKLSIYFFCFVMSVPQQISKKKREASSYHQKEWFMFTYCWFEKYFLQKLFKNLRLSWWPCFVLPNFNEFCWKNGRFWSKIDW